jgi:exocyst complex protein 7
MNNLLYIVQKVKDSELKTLLGDNWIRKRRGQIRQYSTGYLRSSWTRVLACLRDDGLPHTMGSSSQLKAALKDRFKNFNLAFDELYRTQTSWRVVDPQLREELKISICEKVLPAYRSFVGRFRGQLEGGRGSARYIKYNPDDLENQVSDFFEGRKPNA